MSGWKELPKPATPGPWADAGPDIIKPGHLPIPVVEVRRANKQDLHAIAALPEWIEEVERLRAWLDELEVSVTRGGHECAIRAGEWPDGSKP
jgi:hypothetical protein